MEYVYLLIIVGVYFLPTLISYDRKHDSRAGIMALNLLLGWSLIGWIIAFIWALSGKNNKKLNK